MKNNRKNKLKPKYLLGALTVVCVICIGLSVTKGFSGAAGQKLISFIVAPMQSGINSAGLWFSSIADRSHQISALESKNESLTNEVNQLKTQLATVEDNLSEYNELLKLLQISERFPAYEMTGARIISKDPGNWYSSFIINKGSLHGMEKDMNVIDENGLVGIITQVNPTTSVVRSIIDDNSNVSGMVNKNMDICIVNGDLSLIDKGLLNVELISKDTTTVKGDEVVTSYISDKYLPGLLIGYISEIQVNDTDMTCNATLTPAVDFQHLSTIMVIKQLKKDVLLTDGTTTDTTESSVSSESETDTIMETEVSEE